MLEPLCHPPAKLSSAMENPGIHLILSFDLNPPPLAEDPERFYRSGENWRRIFLPGKPRGGTKEKDPMHEWNSLSHVRWDCKYHVVFVPKYRKKQLYGKMRRQVRAVLLDLSRQIGVDVLEGHLMPDHVHMCLRVAPKYSVAHVIGFLKGKSAVRIHRELGHQRMTGRHFWSRGYCVSTVGLDEETIRRYIREQEDRDSNQQRLEFE